jgi:uncharacterized protein with NRDE domain
MCTVTYLPLRNSSFILTSNRDEGKHRKVALPPEKYTINGENVYFPKDMDSGGTWFASSQTKFTLCLLNGAFKRHKHNQPYRLSRGLMVLDFFNYNRAHAFLSQYNFDGIEPFTMLIFEQNPHTSIHEVRWDGKDIYINMKDAALPHIWSSAQLYSKMVIHQRERWFAEWLKAKNKFTMENITVFHKTGGTGNSHTDLLMNRDGKVFTVSITSIKREENEALMRYEDMITGNKAKELKIN